MSEHPIQGLMKTAMENIKEMVDVNTIVGDPVETPDGSVIMPISKVGFGFAAGGSEFLGDTEKDRTGIDARLADVALPFGGGSGGGVSITPIAFLVVSTQGVKIVPLDNQTHLFERLIDSVPQVAEKIQNMIKGTAGMMPGMTPGMTPSAGMTGTGTMGTGSMGSGMTGASMMGGGMGAGSMGGGTTMGTGTMGSTSMAGGFTMGSSNMGSGTSMGSSTMGGGSSMGTGSISSGSTGSSTLSSGSLPSTLMGTGILGSSSIGAGAATTGSAGSTSGSSSSGGLSSIAGTDEEE